MQITHCLHAALLVANLARAEWFYGTVLGLPKVERKLNYPGAWYQVGAFQLHLIEDRSVQVRLQNPEKWGRNSHVAFGVTDLEAVKVRLAAHGCSVQLSSSGRAALFVQDPDGNTIELSVVAARSQT